MDSGAYCYGDYKYTIGLLESSSFYSENVVFVICIMGRWYFIKFNAIGIFTRATARVKAEYQQNTVVDHLNDQRNIVNQNLTSDSVISMFN